MAVNAWCFLVDGLIKGTLDLCERGVKRSANKLSRESSTKRIRSDKVWWNCRRTWTFNGICSFECSLLLPYWSRGIWPYARMGPFRDCRTCSIFRSAQAKMFRVKSHIFHVFGSMLVPRKKSKVGIKDRICIVFYCWRIHDSYPQKKKIHDSWISVTFEQTDQRLKEVV